MTGVLACDTHDDALLHLLESKKGEPAGPPFFNDMGDGDD